MIQAKISPERRVRICVGAAGDGDHRGQLGVAEAGEAASDGHQQKRNRNRGAGRRAAVHERSRRASGAQEVDQQIEHLGVQDGGRFEVLARRRGAGENKNSRADNGADAERRQRPGAEGLLEAMLGLVRIGDQLVDGLAAEQLARRGALARLGDSRSPGLPQWSPCEPLRNALGT